MKEILVSAIFAMFPMCEAIETVSDVRWGEAVTAKGKDIRMWYDEGSMVDLTTTAHTSGRQYVLVAWSTEPTS